ncbi:MAG: ShlB/FhaC/HecB family hemolysin secretion/activation protein [Marinicaulis sp.]|nr:ShlB/FhaC/HecB family hemolysin secretion/activation protein [Marinicaulis sp.]
MSWVRIPFYAVCFAVCATGMHSTSASAQEPPTKIEGLIPSSVRPGVIESTYADDKIPEIGNLPSIVSPYEPAQPEGARAIRFVLTSITIDGAQSIDESVFAPLYAEKIGQEIALGEVFEIARDITRLYAERGYPLSLAYVPAQEIDGGDVRIRVIEGHVETAEISGAKALQSRRLQKLAAKLTAERPLTQSSLERYLLLANQPAGQAVTGVLKKGENGGVGMVLDADLKRLALAAGVNNRASRAVGREQFYARASINSIITGADSLNFSAVQSFELDELTYFAGSYVTAIGAEGLNVTLRASRSEAAPGIPFLRDLGFETMGWTAGVGASYPLILSRDKNLILSASTNWKEFQSAFGVSPNTFDTLWTTSFSAAFSFADDLDGRNALRGEIVRGWDIFNATQAGSPLASRAGAGSEFISLIGEISRTQKINSWLKGIVAINAQTANNPLLSSEQCGYGGGKVGRAFDSFEISGDRCVTGLLELQASPEFLKHGKIAIRPFAAIDAGAVRQIGDLEAGESRTASLYSASAGLRISLSKHVSASVEGGFPLKGSVAQEGDDSARFFFGLEARY